MKADTLDARTLLGAKGTRYGYGFAWHTSGDHYHIERARERRESLTHNGRYMGRAHGIARFATRTTAPAGALVVATGAQALARVATYEARAAQLNDVRAIEYADYVNTR